MPEPPQGLFVLHSCCIFVIFIVTMEVIVTFMATAIVVTMADCFSVSGTAKDASPLRATSAGVLGVSYTYHFSFPPPLFPCDPPIFRGTSYHTPYYCTQLHQFCRRISDQLAQAHVVDHTYRTRCWQCLC